MNRQSVIRSLIVGGSCLIGLAGLGFSALASISSQFGPSRVPVLVELFTSEGCSSCPSADELLIRLDEDQLVHGAFVVPLSEHVDYWDTVRSDPFSDAQFTERQRSYHPLLGSTALYTPEMVVDGRAQFVGSQRILAEHAIAHAATIAKARVEMSVFNQAENSSLHVNLAISGMSSLSIGSPLELWLAVTEMGLQNNVTQDDNAKRHLSHTAVVRLLKQVTTLNGPIPDPYSISDTVTIKPEWNRTRLRIVAFLQESENRYIRGVDQVELDKYGQVTSSLRLTLVSRLTNLLSQPFLVNLNHRALRLFP